MPEERDLRCASTETRACETARCSVARSRTRPHAAAAETKEPKSYPLQSGAWSSCDESSEDETIGETVAKVLKLREPLGERKRGWASSAVNGKECRSVSKSSPTVGWVGASPDGTWAGRENSCFNYGITITIT